MAKVDAMIEAGVITTGDIALLKNIMARLATKGVTEEDLISEAQLIVKQLLDPEILPQRLRFLNRKFPLIAPVVIPMITNFIGGANVKA
jgi:hypothetical protein